MNCFRSLAFLVWISFWSPISFFDSSLYCLHLPAWRSIPVVFIYPYLSSPLPKDCLNFRSSNHSLSSTTHIQRHSLLIHIIIVQQNQQGIYTMCYQLVERYAACRCLYYSHAVDRCASYGRRGHCITQREILVGYACLDHSAPQGSRQYSYASAYSDQQSYSDSGYGSGRSSKSSHRRHR